LDLQLIIGFMLATLALAMMPGPDNIYVLTESISKGWRQGVGITCGLISGVIVHTTVVATGFSLIIFRYDWTYDVLKYAGAAYLLYMMYGVIKEPPMHIEESKESTKEPFLRLFGRGFLMNVLNPKVTLFFMVLLPQFVSNNPDHFSPFWQMSILGLTFMLVSFPVFAGVAVLSGSAAAALSSDRFWTITKWVKVIVLLALSILLLISNKPDSIIVNL
jgi:threonine/homoserine/homoserine lactone efflux protein